MVNIGFEAGRETGIAAVPDKERLKSLQQWQGMSAFLRISVREEELTKASSLL